MNYSRLLLLVLFCSVSFLGCKKSKDSQSSELHASKSNELVSSDTNDLTKYTYNEDTGEHCWAITSHPEARLAHGWVSYVESDSGIEIKEHVGGGSSSSPINEAFELILKPEVNGDLLHLHIVQQWKDRSATIDAKTSYPTSASRN